MKFINKKIYYEVWTVLIVKILGCPNGLALGSLFNMQEQCMHLVIKSIWYKGFQKIVYNKYSIKW